MKDRTGPKDAPETIGDLDRCFDGIIPLVIATVSADGIPNVTYLSRAHPVDDERIAITNQFLSKSTRNLAENPAASILLMQSDTHEDYRLTTVFERTERRGPTFDRLRNDLAVIASLTGMEGTFKLASADVLRVVDVEQTVHVSETELAAHAPDPDAGPGPAQLGELCARLSRCGDLDALVRVAVDGLAELLGYRHSQLLLLDEDGARLFTIASHGYDTGGVGAEVAIGEGAVGAAALRSAPVLVGNVRQMRKYSGSIRRAYAATGEMGPGHEIPMVGLDRPGSQLAVPALALGQLVGVLFVEDETDERFSNADAALLVAVASVVASSIESLRTEVRTAGAVAAAVPASTAPPTADTVHLRHFTVDGSTFLDGDYLIKGVAGRLLWSLAQAHETEGRTEFTNREVRLDPTLDLPDFRDNFESRLILLKRRLDEREAPLRIEKTGRGRFRLVVDAPLRLDAVGDPGA